LSGDRQIAEDGHADRKSQADGLPGDQPYQGLQQALPREGNLVLDFWSGGVVDGRVVSRRVVSRPVIPRICGARRRRAFSAVAPLVPFVLDRKRPLAPLAANRLATLRVGHVVGTVAVRA